MTDIDDINISTTTVIVTTNLNIHLDWLYHILSVDELSDDVVFKTTKEFQNYIISKNPKEGTITMVQHKEKLKGFKIKKKKTRFFRNALSLVMYVGKLITIKVPKKGKLQLTGCITDEHTESCIRYLWEILSKYPQGEETYQFTTDDYFKTNIRTVMTDIVFKLGFDINRQKLDRFMNQHTEFNSLLETSFGYTGVNIKIPFEMDMDQTLIKLLWCKEGKWEQSYITYTDYLNTLSSKDKEKELHKKRKNTFLVFHSGTAIMSGMTIQYMKDIYYEFFGLLKNSRDEIEEHIV